MYKGLPVEVEPLKRKDEKVNKKLVGVMTVIAALSASAVAEAVYISITGQLMTLLWVILKDRSIPLPGCFGMILPGEPMILLILNLLMVDTPL